MYLKPGKAGIKGVFAPISIESLSFSHTHCALSFPTHGCREDEHAGVHVRRGTTDFVFVLSDYEDHLNIAGPSACLPMLVGQAELKTTSGWEVRFAFAPRLHWRVKLTRSSCSASQDYPVERFVVQNALRKAASRADIQLSRPPSTPYTVLPPPPFLSLAMTQDPAAVAQAGLQHVSACHMMSRTLSRMHTDGVAVWTEVPVRTKTKLQLHCFVFSHCQRLDSRTFAAQLAASRRNALLPAAPINRINVTS